MTDPSGAEEGRRKTILLRRPSTEKNTDDEPRAGDSPSGPTFTVDEITEFSGFGKYQMVLTFLASYAWSLFLGRIVGSPGFGIISDCYGRKLYSWPVGTMVLSMCAWLVMSFLKNWRYLMALVSIPTLINVCLVQWYPESARYYLVSGQYGRAAKQLEQLVTVNKKTMPTGHLYRIREEDNEFRGRMLNLLRAKHWRSTLLFLYLWFACGFSYYGLLFLGFDFLKNQRLRGLVLFTCLVKWARRRHLLGLSSAFAGLIICVGIVDTTNTTLLRGVFLCSRILFSALHQVVFVMTAEVYPTTLRGTAVGVGDAFEKMGGAVVPFIVQILMELSPGACLGLLAGVAFLAASAATLLPHETRGVHLKDLSVQFSGG